MQSLRDALSQISAGATDSLGPDLHVSGDGDAFRVRIDLPQLAPPRHAALTANARQLPSGVWHFDAVAIPSHATLSQRHRGGPASPVGRVSYDVAHQSGQAQAGPDAATPATSHLSLDGVTLHDSSAGPGGDMTIGHVGLNSAVTGEGSAGLPSRFALDGELHRIHAAGRPHGGAEIDEARFALAGDTHHGRADAQVDVGLDGLALSDVPGPLRALVPRHVTMRVVASGLRAEAARRFLMAALMDGASPAALHAQAIALLHEPGARASIEALSADVGPMHLEGSARLRPLADGAIISLHLTADGLDALLQSLQADPAGNGALPALLLAKGLSRPEGHRLAWDIVLGPGIATVNDIPLGPQGRDGASARLPGPGRR